MENNYFKIWVFLAFWACLSVSAESTGKTSKSPISFKSLGLSAGLWHSKTSRTYETVSENFFTLPTASLLAMAGPYYIRLTGGAQWVTREDNFRYQDQYAGTPLTLSVSRGNKLKWIAGFSFPMYSPGTPPSSPFLGTGNIFASLGLRLSLPKNLGSLNGQLPGGNLGVTLGAETALNRSLAKPGSGIFKGGLFWGFKALPNLYSGLNWGYALEYWRWNEEGGGEEFNHNITLSVPLRLRLTRKQHLGLSAGWLAWNRNQREANGGTFYADIKGFFLGAGWDYRL